MLRWHLSPVFSLFNFKLFCFSAMWVAQLGLFNLCCPSQVVTKGQSEQPCPPSFLSAERRSRPPWPDLGGGRPLVVFWGLALGRRAAAAAAAWRSASSSRTEPSTSLRESWARICWTSSSTTTWMWTASEPARELWPAPRATSSSRKKTSKTSPMKPRTKNWICWIWPMAWWRPPGWAARSAWPRRWTEWKWPCPRGSMTRGRRKDQLPKEEEEEKERFSSIYCLPSVDFCRQLMMQWYLFHSVGGGGGNTVRLPAVVVPWKNCIHKVKWH